MEMTAKKAVEYLHDEYVLPNVFGDPEVGVALQAIEDALNLAYAALEKVEWHSQWEDDVHCPFCDNLMPLLDPHLGHLSSCPRQLAIAAIGV